MDGQTLIGRIRAMSLSARRDRDERLSRLLVTLVAEAERVGKDAGNRPPSDPEVVAVIRKFAKGVSETLAARPGDPVATFESGVLESLLPAQMSAEDIRAFVDSVIASMPSGVPAPKVVGLVMARLKADRPGMYDGRLASDIIREATGT